MHVAKAMEINEGIQHRFEHFASFGSREGALGKNLGEVFLGILHHNVETIPVFDAAAADFVDAQQIGMNELHDAATERDLEIRVGTSRNELDGRLFGLRFGKLREENSG